MVYQIAQMAKISPAFLQRLSDTACCIAQMYKVELRGVGLYEQSVQTSRIVPNS